MTMPETDTTSVPRIWAGCYACYLQGRRTGDWYDATEALRITPACLHHVPAARVPVGHDTIAAVETVGFPEVGDLLSMPEVHLWAEALTSVEPHLRPALVAWVDGGDYVAQGRGTALPCVDEFEERYCGEWEGFEEFAHEEAGLTCLLEDVPDEIARHFSMESWTAELAEGYTTAPCPTGGVYVYHRY